MGLGAGQTMIFTTEGISIIGVSTEHFWMPYRGRIISLTACQDIKLTVADSTTTVVGLAVVIAFTGAAIGDIDTDFPTAATKDAAGGYFEAGDVIALTSDAGGTAGIAMFTLIVSAQDR